MSRYQTEQRIRNEAESIIEEAYMSSLETPIPAMFAEGNEVEAIEDFLEWGLSRGIFTNAELAKAMRGGLLDFMNGHWAAFSRDWVDYFVDRELTALEKFA